MYDQRPTAAAATAPHMNRWIIRWAAREGSGNDGRVQPSDDVADGARLGAEASVWHLAQVREGAVLDKNCTVGRGAYADAGVRIGDNCKL